MQATSREVGHRVTVTLELDVLEGADPEAAIRDLVRYGQGGADILNTRIGEVDVRDADGEYVYINREGLT